MKLHVGDFLIIALYLFTLGAIVLWSTRRRSETAEFLLAGRKLTLPVFVGTLVATWYGGILGIAESTVKYGLVTWLTQGILWYVVYLLFAVFFATRIASLKFYTVVDVLEAQFGRAAALVGGFFTFLMVNPAPYLFSLGVITQVFTGLSLGVAIALSALFIVAYTMISGFRGVVFSDCCQCFWMYLAFGLLALMAVNTCGGIPFLERNLAGVPGYEHHMRLTGDASVVYILAWGGIACWVLVDPNFYQRCYAARSPEVARRGVIVATVFWAVFDLLSCGTALYAAAARNAQMLSFSDPASAHLVLADYLLPSPLKGLFLAGVLANVISTADSYLFAGATVIARDCYWRYFNRDAQDRHMVRVTRLGILVTAALAAALALFCPSVVRLWYTIGTIGVSAILLPMLLGLFCRDYCLAKAALASMLAGAAFSFSWLMMGRLHNGYFVYPLGLEPLYPGLMAALVAYAAVFVGSNLRSRG